MSVFEWLSGGRRPVPRGRRGELPVQAVMIGRVQMLEERRMLANVIDVRIDANRVSLTDVVSQDATAGDSFDIAYTGTQVTLTAKTGTQLSVDGTTKTTHTFTAAQPIHLFVAVNAPGNTLTITGDSQPKFASMEIRYGNNSGNNSMTLNKVVADSLTVIGRKSNTSVTINDSTINGALRSQLRHHSTGTGSLALSNTTVKGAVRAEGQKFAATKTTFESTVSVQQKENGSTFTTTASTYNKSVGVVQGQNGTFNINASPDGSNKFLGDEVFKARKGSRSTMNMATNGATNVSAPRLVNIESKTITPPTAPTVDAATVTESPDTITGTYDSVNGKTLKVTVADKTYTLGTDSQLTAPSTGKWSLNTSSVTIPNGANTVTVDNTDTQGNTTRGTGTITVTPAATQQSIIDTHLAANQLTATKTASGLNYVVQTQGTGSVPTNGQTLSVNYTGYLLNSDGTQGTKFDSNVDPQFNHVQPFTFPLGQRRVIAGWDEAFALLPVGTVAKLLIPSALAYGSAGTTNIPADSILIFDVTLVSAT